MAAFRTVLLQETWLAWAREENRGHEISSLGASIPHANRLLPQLRGVRPRPAGRAGPAGRGGRLRRAVDQRPLPPLEQRAGSEPVRLGRHRRDLPGLPAARDDGRDRARRCGCTRRSSRRRRPPPPSSSRAGSPSASAPARRSTSTSSVTAWPSEDVRLEMLEEAVEVMRELWTGEFTYHRGPHYTVENARIYTRPDEPPEGVHVGFGREVVRPRGAHRRRLHHHAAGRRAGSAVAARRPAATSRPRRATRSAVADTEDEGVEIAHRLWANAGLPGELSQVLPSPKHFEQASELVTEEMTRRVDRLRQGRRPSTSRRSRRTPRQASTRSTSPTWGRTTVELLRAVRRRGAAPAAWRAMRGRCDGGEVLGQRQRGGSGPRAD